MSKITYAQSSDIKSRTFLEYRRDMKKKAIAELEMREWLQNILRARHGKPAIAVRKHGGDADLWFNTRGGVTQEPDYAADFGDGKILYYEFQYAENSDALLFFDFKLSKVGKKRGGERLPHQDREFFYVVKSRNAYAFLPPAWIMQNGKEGAVPAWGNRLAYRVPRDVFLAQTQNGGDELKSVVGAIDDKNRILDFQHQFIAREIDRVARILESAVDEQKIIKIIPSTLEGFYRVCLILDRMNRAPENAAVWLVYLISFFGEKMPTRDFARLVFCFDFLYFKVQDSLRENEIKAAADALDKSVAYIKARENSDGSFASDPNFAPAEETRSVLFAVNLIEDIAQDLRYTCGVGPGPIGKIFETISDCAKIGAFIKQADNDDAAD